MATTAKKGPQDMPPPGGYNPLQTGRVRLRNIITAPLTIGLFVASQIIGFTVYGYTHKEIKQQEIEMRSARFAVMPLLLAERDRKFLKQIKINREEERELMKNVPEWEVGTYFGEPIYITRPKDEFIAPTFQEFYAHSSWTETIASRMLRRHLF